MTEHRISGNLNVRLIESKINPNLVWRERERGRSQAYTIDFDNDFQDLSLSHICRECGQDHGFRPSFEDIKTSIDIIPSLFRPRDKRGVENEGAEV